MKRAVRYGGHYSSSNEEVSETNSLASICQRVVELKWSCVQIFLGNSSSLTRKKPNSGDIMRSAELLRDHNIGFYTHFPYIMNLTKCDGTIKALQTELDTIAPLGGRCVVHPNSYTEAKSSNKQIAQLLQLESLTRTQEVKLAEWRSDCEVAISNIVANVRELDLSADIDCPLLLEPPAGEGRKFGWRMEQLEQLFKVLPDNVGLCIDTCHLYAAGQCKFQTPSEVDELFARLDAAVGLRKVKLVHLNDSVGPFGCMTDRHASLTSGSIWNTPASMEGLIRLWQLCATHGIDVVSEVSATRDFYVMQALSNINV